MESDAPPQHRGKEARKLAENGLEEEEEEEDENKKELVDVKNDREEDEEKMVDDAKDGIEKEKEEEDEKKKELVDNTQKCIEEEKEEEDEEEEELVNSAKNGREEDKEEEDEKKKELVSDAKIGIEEEEEEDKKNELVNKTKNDIEDEKEEVEKKKETEDDGEKDLEEEEEEEDKNKETVNGTEEEDDNKKESVNINLEENESEMEIVEEDEEEKLVMKDGMEEKEMEQMEISGEKEELAVEKEGEEERRESTSVEKVEEKRRESAEEEMQEEEEEEEEMELQIMEDKLDEEEEEEAREEEEERRKEGDEKEQGSFELSTPQPAASPLPPPSPSSLPTLSSPPNNASPALPPSRSSPTSSTAQPASSPPSPPPSLPPPTSPQSSQPPSPGNPEMVAAAHLNQLQQTMVSKILQYQAGVIAQYQYQQIQQQMLSQLSTGNSGDSDAPHITITPQPATPVTPQPSSASASPPNPVTPTPPGKNTRKRRAARMTFNPGTDETNNGEYQYKRKRTAFNDKQYKVLETTFEHNNFPDPIDQHCIALRIKTPYRSIKMWFQKKRASVRKRMLSNDKDSNSTDKGTVKNACDPDTRWYCTKCRATFIAKKFLENHKEAHQQETLKCPHCTMGFTHRVLLDTHLISKCSSTTGGHGIPLAPVSTTDRSRSQLQHSSVRAMHNKARKLTSSIADNLAQYIEDNETKPDIRTLQNMDVPFTQLETTTTTSTITTTTPATPTTKPSQATSILHPTILSSQPPTILTPQRLISLPLPSSSGPVSFVMLIPKQLIQSSSINNISSGSGSQISTSSTLTTVSAGGSTTPSTTTATTTYISVPISLKGSSKANPILNYLLESAPSKSGEEKKKSKALLNLIPISQSSLLTPVSHTSLLNSGENSEGGSKGRTRIETIKISRNVKNGISFDGQISEKVTEPGTLSAGEVTPVKDATREGGKSENEPSTPESPCLVQISTKKRYVPILPMLPLKDTVQVKSSSPANTTPPTITTTTTSISPTTSTATTTTISVTTTTPKPTTSFLRPRRSTTHPNKKFWQSFEPAGYKRRRTPTYFTGEQREVMEAHFNNDNFPEPGEQMAIAHQLSVDYPVVKTWFQKTRKNLRRQLKEEDNFDSDGPFHCLRCNVTFISRSSLVRHTQDHKKETPHHCCECDMYFSHPIVFNTHLMCHISEFGTVLFEL